MDNVPVNYKFFDPGTKQQRKSTHHCESQRKVLTIKSAKAAIQCPDMSRSVPSCGTLNRDCGEAKFISRRIAQSDSCNEKLKPRESDEFGYRKKFVDTNIKLFASTEGDQLDFLTHRRNIYSIESVSDSLGITNRLHEYNCMDTLSNTETLAIGSTMSDHKFQMENTESLSKPSSSLTKIIKTEQLDYILTEKRVSPPFAFVDKVG